MFCKPPCPDEHELAPVADHSDDRSGPKHTQALRSHDDFGRLITLETAGPEQGLPPAPVRAG